MTWAHKARGSEGGEPDETGFPREGYQLGDLAGAVSLAIPMEVYEAEARERAELEAIERGLDPSLVLDDSVVEIPQGASVAKFAELLGEVVTSSTKKNLEMRVAAENGATAGKFDLAKRAKALNLDAIHDTVHEMAKDEARHGKAFEGLLNRYFG